MRPPDDRKTRRTHAAPYREYSRARNQSAREEAAKAEEELRAYWGDNVLPLRRDLRLVNAGREYSREDEPLPKDALEESKVASTRGNSEARRRGQLREPRLTSASGDDVRAAAAARLKKARRGRAPRTLRTSLWMISTLGAWLLLLAYSINNYRNYRVFQNLADSREVQLAALETQLRAGQQKLAFMRMPQGREQLMMEHGYLRPGDRILLFPEEESAASKSRQNHDVPAILPVAPTPIIAENEDGKSVSAWSRAAETAGDWYKTLREASGSSPDAS